MELLPAIANVVLDPTNLLVLFAGTAIGVFVGAIPGLTATMAVALALPFTFGLSPLPAILLLVGIYKGGIYGGSITSILINTPGTPAGACTVLDGYPLAQKGAGRAALEMALYASVIADFISNVALLAFAGYIAQLAMQFQAPQYFWLIVFSLTVVISVSGDSLLKGLVSAAIGVLLSSVGLDLVFGTERFTFGTPHLFDGLNIVPLIVGLFALPEVISYYAQRTSAEVLVVDQMKRLAPTEVARSLKTIVKGSLIGVFIGSLPGIGAAPAAFVSYAEARRSSPRRQNFGKGELEGVAAAEAGNNGTAGATLIPLLSLGIPGDTVTAVMLGAFMIHGLTPGPVLFQEQLPFVYSLFIGIMVSSVALLFVGRLAIEGSTRITETPRHLLMPVIVVFCVLGAYAVNNTFFDVGVMAAAGIAGFTMLRLGIPLAPLIIGLVLGSLLEDNFRRTLLIGRGEPGAFFDSWLSWLFVVLAALSVAIGLLQHRAPSLTPTQDGNVDANGSRDDDTPSGRSPSGRK